MNTHKNNKTINKININFSNFCCSADNDIDNKIFSCNLFAHLQQVKSKEKPILRVHNNICHKSFPGMTTKAPH